MTPRKSSKSKKIQNTKKRDWSAEEKANLLESVHKFGPTNLDLLLPAIPGRSHAWLQVYLNALKYEGKWCIENEGIEGLEEPYLEQWLHAFHAKDERGGLEQDFSYLVSEFLTVIAMQEKHPSPEKCAGVDFAELYQYLAHLTKGLPPPKLRSAASARFLYSVTTWITEIKDKKDLSPHKAFLQKCKTLGTVPQVDEKCTDASLNLLHAPPHLLQFNPQDANYSFEDILM